MLKNAYVLANGKYEWCALKDGELYLISGKSFSKNDILYADGEKKVDADIPADFGAILAAESLLIEKNYLSDYKFKDSKGNELCAADCNNNYFIFPNTRAKNIKKSILVRYNKEDNSFNIVGTDISIGIKNMEFEDDLENKISNYSEFMETYNYAYQHPLMLNIDEEIPVEYNTEAAKRFKGKICKKEDLYRIKYYECILRDNLVKQYNKTVQIDEELAYFENYMHKHL